MEIGQVLNIYKYFNQAFKEREERAEHTRRRMQIPEPFVLCKTPAINFKERR